MFAFIRSSNENLLCSRTFFLAFIDFGQKTQHHYHEIQKKKVRMQKKLFIFVTFLIKLKRNSFIKYSDMFSSNCIMGIFVDKFLGESYKVSQSDTEKQSILFLVV